MLNISEKLAEYLIDHRYCTWSMDIVFEDGTYEHITENDLVIDGCRISSGSGTSSLSLGQAISKYIEVSIYNDDYRYDTKDFFGARIDLFCSYEYEDGSTERLYIGRFTVTEPETYGSVINLVAYDPMYLADAKCEFDFEGKTLFEIYRRCCSDIGLLEGTSSFTGKDFVVKNVGDVELTYKQALGYVAMIAGGNAYVDGSSVYLSSYANYSVDDTNVDITDFSAGSVVTNGNASGTITIVSDSMSHTICTDDVVVTGVSTEVSSDGENVIYSNGTDGYMLQIENPFINGNPQLAVDYIAQSVVGMKFRPFSSDIQCLPVVEFGDPCLVADRNKNLHASLITDVEINFKGFTSVSCNANSPARNSSDGLSSSDEIKTLIAARKVAIGEVVKREKNFIKLPDLLSKSFGLFTTQVKQDDGDTIFYLHNKPDLDQSRIMYMLSADGFYVSSDYGETWAAGIDTDGNAVFNVLEVVGIKAEWIDIETLQTLIAHIGDRDGNHIDILNNGIAILDGSEEIAMFGNTVIELPSGEPFDLSEYKIESKNAVAIKNRGSNDFVVLNEGKDEILSDATIRKAKGYIGSSNNLDEATGAGNSKQKMLSNMAYIISDTGGEKSARIILKSIAFRSQNAAGEETGEIDFNKIFMSADSVEVEAPIFNAQGEVRGKKVNAADIISLNDKEWNDGRTGAYIHKAGYMQLHRDSSDGNPYIQLARGTGTQNDQSEAYLMMQVDASNNATITTTKALYLGSGDKVVAPTSTNGDVNLGSNAHRWNELSAKKSSIGAMTAWNNSGYGTYDQGDGQLNLRRSSGGTLRFWYGTNTTNYTNLVGQNVTAVRSVNLPSTGGTLALASSDVRIKENIEDTEIEALPIIEKIRLRKFDFTDKRTDSHREIGFIADELEEIDERFVLEGTGGYTEDGEMNIKCVDEFYMMGYAIKAIQELKAEVDRLKSELDALRKGDA